MNYQEALTMTNPVPKDAAKIEITTKEGTRIVHYLFGEYFYRKPLAYYRSETCFINVSDIISWKYIDENLNN